MSEIATIKEQLVRARARQSHIIEENKILGYAPCCTEHHGAACPDPCGTSKHVAFHRSRAKNRWAFGGNSSGKSFLGVAEGVIHYTFKTHPFSHLELPHPGFHRIGIESFRKFESFYMPLLKEWIPRKMLLGGSWSDAYNSKYNILRLSNGDQVGILSYDMTTDQWETDTLHTCWADEKIPEDKYDATLARLLRTNGYFWGTVTPIAGMPWLLTRVWGLNTADTQTWVVDMDENPYIDSEAKRRIMSDWSPEEREARKSGRPMQFQGIVYPEISEDVHLVAVKPEPHWPLYFCMDAHPRKECQMLWIAIDPGGKAYCVDELSLRGTPQVLAEAIFRKEFDLRRWIGAPFRGVQKRWIDLSAITLDSEIQDNYNLLAEFRKAGLAFSQANRSGVGYSVVHQYLHYDKAKPVGGFNKPMFYFVRDRVPKTYFSMTHLMYDEFQHRGTRDPKERVKDWGKDPADCVRYILIERPKFQMITKPMSYGAPDLASCYVN